MPITTTARKVYTINWHGDEHYLVEFADELSLKILGERLDSFDLGDATGAICRLADLAEEEDAGTDFTAISAGGDLLSCSISWEPFEHEFKAAI